MVQSTFEEEIEKSGSLTYTVAGTSMLPLLRQHRDIVVIRKPVGRLKKYDVAFYKTPDGRYVLHRVLGVREKDYVICGDHCIRREYGVTDAEILGVMCAYTRGEKTVYTDNPGYRIYSHLIGDLFFVKAAVLWCIRKAKAVIRKLFR